LSLIKEVVPDAQMNQAMAVRTVINRGTKLLGPTLSGALVALVGARAPFYIDAVSFAAAAASSSSCQWTAYDSREKGCQPRGDRCSPLPSQGCARSAMWQRCAE